VNIYAFEGMKIERGEPGIRRATVPSSPRFAVAPNPAPAAEQRREMGAAVVLDLMASVAAAAESAASRPTN
jgi:hypothetical protein